MIILRKRLRSTGDLVRVRYAGTFQCLCGHNYPIVDVTYTRQMILAIGQRRAIKEMVKINRIYARKTIEWEVENFINCS